MANQTSLSQSIIDNLVGMRSIFSKKKDGKPNSSSSIASTNTPTRRGNKTGGAVITNNAFYTTISEGQLRPLKKGDGLANIFAKIYNLLKVQRVEEMKQHRLEKNMMRNKNKGWKGFFEGRPKKEKITAVAVKEEDNVKDEDKSKSIFGKIFGLLFSGLKTVIGGMISVVSSTIGVLSSVVWGLMKTVKTVLGFLPGILSTVSGVVGIVAKFVEKMVLRVAFGIFMPKVFSGIMTVVSFLSKSIGKGAVRLLGAPIAAILGVSAAVAAGYEAVSYLEEINQGTFNDAFVKDDSGMKAELDTAKTERDKKLSELDAKYSISNKIHASTSRDPLNDPGVPSYVKEREKIEEQYGTTRSKLQEEQNKYFIEEIEPILRKLGYTTDGPDGTERYVPPGSNGLSIPAIRKGKDRREISGAEYIYLAERLSLTKKISGIMQDIKTEMITNVKENPIVKSITDEMEYLEQKKNDSIKKFEGLKNDTGEELNKLFKDFNLNKDDLEFLKPIVSKSSEIVNVAKNTSNTIRDSSVIVRTDDDTLQKITKQNLRPV
jgi:hypothetical protein